MADYQSIFTGEQIDERLSQVPNKQDKVQGKVLSSNDFTDAFKAKLEGVPAIVATPQDIADAVGAEASARQAADTALGGRIDNLDIPTKTSDLENDSYFQTEDDVDAKVAVETARATGEEARIEGITDKLVLNGMTVSEDGSTVQLSIAKINIKTGATSSVDVPLPVADANGAGVLNPQTYQTIMANQTLINAIIGASVAVSGLAAEPTQAQVTNAWLTASGLEELVNGARLFDVTNTKVWTYYTNTELWYPVEAEGGGSVVIAQWTNTALGTIKGVADNTGHTNDGKLTAETDGTGSVLGWDRLVSRVQTIESNKSGWDAKYDKPSSGIPSTDMASAVQTSLEKADSALQPSALNAYRTASEQDAIDAGKQDTIDSSHKLAAELVADPVIGTSMPTGGFASGKIYRLGVVGNMTFLLADGLNGTYYKWTFETGATAPSLTFPSGIEWSEADGSPVEPTIEANKHYEINIEDGYAFWAVFGKRS